MTIKEIANDIYELTGIDINTSIEDIYSLEGDEPYYEELHKYYRLISDIQYKCKHLNLKKNVRGETTCRDCLEFMAS